MFQTRLKDYARQEFDLLIDTARYHQDKGHRCFRNGDPIKGNISAISDIKAPQAVNKIIF